MHCTGQHHEVSIAVCESQCQSVLERIVELGWWPASPSRPNLVFTLDLMNTVHNLVLKCHASLLDISKFLRMTGVKQLKVCSSLSFG